MFWKQILWQVSNAHFCRETVKSLNATTKLKFVKFTFSFPGANANFLFNNISMWSCYEVDSINTLKDNLVNINKPPSAITDW